VRPTNPNEQDYAYGQLSLTAKKLRRLEITAGAPRWQSRSGVWAANHAMRQPNANWPSKPMPPTNTSSETAKPQDPRRDCQQAALDVYPSTKAHVSTAIERYDERPPDGLRTLIGATRRRIRRRFADRIRPRVVAMRHAVVVDDQR
jgi:hypothetical protein